MECLPFTTTDEQLEALDDVIGYYRSNQKRMKYRTFREDGLPVGSGIVESAHRHVLQTRMKRAGQRWGFTRARRMVRLRAAYRTAGAFNFHRAIHVALAPPSSPPSTPKPLANAPRRVAQPTALSRISPLNRAQLASK